MIGVFTVPIGQIMDDIKAEREAETAVIDKINQELKKILDGGEY